MERVEIKIGIQQVAREVSLETNESADDVLAAFNTAHAEGGVLKVTDQKGRTIVVPVSKIGYLELGTEQSRQVGFGAV